jgi:hypothetical protein
VRRKILGLVVMGVIAMAGMSDRASGGAGFGLEQVGRCADFNRPVKIYGPADKPTTLVLHVDQHCSKPLEIVVYDGARHEVARDLASPRAWTTRTVRLPIGGRIELDNTQNPFPSDDRSPVSVKFEAPRR